MLLKDASAFVTNFKGAALSCLILMWSMRDSQRNWNRDNLAMLVGYNPKSVAIGLQRLALHGLVVRLNYENWQLTDKGYQFTFADLRVQKMDSESPKNGLLGSSSSLLINSHEHEESDIRQLPLQTLRVQKTDSQPETNPDLDRLTDVLVQRTACPRPKAQAAIASAMAAGLSPLLIEYRILIWLAYCLSSNGRNLNPAHFVASRIRERCCPDSFKKSSIKDDHYDLYLELNELEKQLDSCEDCTDEESLPS